MADFHDTLLKVAETALIGCFETYFHNFYSQNTSLFLRENFLGVRYILRFWLNLIKILEEKGRKSKKSGKVREN